MRDLTRFGATIALGGFFVALDQTLKFIVRTHPGTVIPLWGRFLSWEYFQNFGIAFSIPLPQTAVILFTPILLVALAYGARTATNVRAQSGFLLILCGALSNYTDRLFFGATTDYLRIGTGIVNIADMLIAIGLASIIFAKRL
jgi:lipoprotein signal peptidase